MSLMRWKHQNLRIVYAFDTIRRPNPRLIRGLMEPDLTLTNTQTLNSDKPSHKALQTDARKM